jgi:serine protease inhibitor
MNDDRDDEQVAETAASAVRVLARRTPATVGWRPADSVRRAVVIRRRRRWSIGAGVVIVAAVATALTLTTGGGTTSQVAVPSGSVHTTGRIDGAIQLVANTAPVTTADPSAVDEVVAAEQRLSLALLDKIGDGSNVSVSPASLYLALGMLQNAARGETATQIAKALQASGLSTADQNAGLAGLLADLNSAAAKDGITLDSANSLWQQRGFDVRKQFLATLAAYYRAGVWQVDYSHDMSGALKALNDWTTRQTHGKITKLFDDLDPSTVLVLANAIYFHAAWATPFDKNETVDGQFTTANGTPVQAKFMSGGAGLQGAITDDYQAVQLPYKGGRFAALAIMPTSGSLQDFVHSLSSDQIGSIASSLDSGVTVSMPRFTTTAKIDLKPVLQSLGMTTAFSDAADMSGLSDRVSTKVDQVIQRVYLGVGEKGTTAAAVTGISMMPTSVGVGPQVRLDHPFLFLVRDTRTGAILFASEVEDPSAAG